MAHGRIRKESLEKLIAHINLADYLGGFLDVRRSGQNYTARCPFHNEKTASFYIYDDHYHCFGCKAHGNAIDFEMHRTGATFPEAAESLAERTRFALEYEDGAPSVDAKEAEDSKRLLHIMNEVCKRFEQYLYSDAEDAKMALEYLKQRGFSTQQIKHWQIGLSPTGNKLLRLAQDRGWDLNDLKSLGLIREHQTRGPYDFFRGRIMFPIHNEKAQVIAFGGRVFKKNEANAGPKYINSTESKLFSKSSTLFHFHQARAAIVRDKNAIIVEGYMDAIALSNAGFDAVVAVLGTALTAEHVKKLARLTNTLTLCFDSDNAGQNALVRSFEVAYPLNLVTLQAIQIPAGKDPDDFLKSQGASSMQKLIENPAPLLDVVMRQVLKGVSNRDAQVRAIKDKVVPVIMSNADIAQREIALDAMRSILGLSSTKGLQQNVVARRNVKSKSTETEDASSFSGAVSWQPESLEILKFVLALATAKASDVPKRLKNTLDDVTSDEPMDEIICGKAIFNDEVSQKTKEFLKSFNRLWNLDPTRAPWQWEKDALEEHSTSTVPSDLFIILALVSDKPVDKLLQLGWDDWAAAWTSAPPFRPNRRKSQENICNLSIQNTPYLRFLSREIALSVNSKALPIQISDLLLKLEFAYLDKELLLARGSDERSRRILQERARRQQRYQG